MKLKLFIIITILTLLIVGCSNPQNDFFNKKTPAIKSPEPIYEYFPSNWKTSSLKERTKNSDRYYEYQTIGYLFSNNTLPQTFNVQGENFDVTDISVKFEEYGFYVSLTGKYNNSNVQLLARKNNGYNFQGHVAHDVVEDRVSCSPKESYKSYNEFIILSAIDVNTTTQEWNFIEIGYQISNSNLNCITRFRTN